MRRSYREGGKIKTETVGSLSRLPAHVIDLIRSRLAGTQFLPASGIQIERILTAARRA